MSQITTNSSQEVRVRFAPSPTGFLHIGGTRTALFNWLFARAHKGKFLLRIEDTDPTRSESRFTDDILESLTWLDLKWDEEPLFQSSRFESYRKIASMLLDKGLAFRCDCTPQTLDAIRAKCEKEKKPFRYPGTCREKKLAHKPSVVRMKVPSEGTTSFTDLIRGEISFLNKDIDDWVILRNDETPTYNFSVVVDDHFQRVSHVLRGDDHINNTPKQILLYQTLNYPVPNFAHLPMILGTDRSKLSKRHGALSTLEYRKMGYLPDAIINFLVRLGWGHGDQEIFSRDELIQYFSIDKIGKASAIFNQEKLVWLSGHYMRETKSEFLIDYLNKYFLKECSWFKSTDRSRFIRGISIIQGKVKTIPELIEQLDCLFGEDPTLLKETLKTEDEIKQTKMVLSEMLPTLLQNDFTGPQLETSVRKKAESLGLKFGVVAHTLRYAVTGGRISPGLFEMLESQGKETVVRRVEKALHFLCS